MSAMDSEAMGWHAESASGVVAAGGAEAVAAGVQMLSRGGNAADAAVATLLALAITDYGNFAMGGEVPFIIYDAASAQAKVLSGLGRSPLSPEAVDWYWAHGIPTDGDMKAAPVPAAVDLCLTALRRFGTLSFAEAVGPTLALLDRSGPAWYPLLSATLRRLIEAEAGAYGSREAGLQAAADRFYRGDVADDLEAYYIKKGGFLRWQDLATHITLLEDPVTLSYRGYTICKCGPWTQGPFLLQALRLLESYDLKALGHLSPDYIHIVIEAIKLAMADRDAYYGDPAHVHVPLEQLLSDAYTVLRRPLIDLQRASLEARPGDPYGMRPLLGGGVFRPLPGGTTTCVVADRWGNVVAATPSCNVFGNKGEGGATGVTHGNRLRCLNTTAGHPNRLEPGKRPRITLTPTLVLKDGAPVLAISVAGGDLQDQVTLNLLLDALEFGIPPEEAVRLPRFATEHHQNSFDPHPQRDKAFLLAGSLILNEAIVESTRTTLAGRGHAISVRSGPVGDPVILQIDRAAGKLVAAGDPAAGRHAAGLPD